MPLPGYSSARSILIVDDDPGIREALQDVLELEGYDVESLENGKAALESLLRRADRNASLPRLILLDLMMPVMTGWQFLDSLRADARFREVPVLVFSAAGDRQVDLPRATALIRKPVEVDELLAAVAKHLGSSST